MKSIIALIHNSFLDPLFYGNLYNYLSDLADEKKVKIYLITYEQKKYELDKNEKKILKKQYLEKNIIWIPLKWKSGRFKLLKKSYEFLISYLIIGYLRIFKKAKFIISLGTISGSYAYIISLFYKLNLIMYQFEPHSQYLKDGKLPYSKIGLYLLEKAEKLILKNSHTLITTTYHFYSDIIKIKKNPRTYIIPSCCNENIFLYSPQKREELRQKYNIKNRKVLIYTGKFGDLYYSAEEVLEFFKYIKNIDDDWVFFILTPQDIQEIKDIINKLNIKDCYIKNANYHEVPSYLSMADIGIVAIPPLKSNKYRSPIKTGEYLCNGLPYIVPKGISHDDEIAIKYNVGVVIENLSKEEVERVYDNIIKLISEDKIILSERCREIGIKYRGLSVLKPKMKKILLSALYDEKYQENNIWWL